MVQEMRHIRVYTNDIRDHVAITSCGAFVGVYDEISQSFRAVATNAAIDMLKEREWHVEFVE